MKENLVTIVTYPSPLRNDTDITVERMIFLSLNNILLLCPISSYKEGGRSYGCGLQLQSLPVLFLQESPF